METQRNDKANWFNSEQNSDWIGLEGQVFQFSSTFLLLLNYLYLDNLIMFWSFFCHEMALWNLS